MYQLYRLHLFWISRNTVSKALRQNKLFFLGFVILFVAVFLLGTTMIKVGVVESYEGELHKEELYVEGQDFDLSLDGNVKFKH